MPRCFSGLLAKPFEAKSSLAVDVIGFGMVKELLEVLISPGLISETEKISTYIFTHHRMYLLHSMLSGI